MFRRHSHDEQSSSSATAVLEHRDPQAPKGRPTPKRSDAQTRRRTAMKAPNDRKAASRQAREVRRAEMAKQRQALASGDERYLPARDKGPVRRFTRDYVDAHYRAAEFFLPIAVVILVLSIVRVSGMQALALLMWLLVILAIVGDSIVTGFRLRAELHKRFPGKNTRGAVAYGLMRSLQMRRMRLPKPQVSRGTKL